MNKNTTGFTLLELLVAMTVTGVLIASAIPHFQAYRQRAFDLRAETDLRNVALAEEAYFIDAEHYLPCSQEGCSQLPGIVALSQGVELSVTATDTAFVGTARHAKGTGKAYRWDSQNGGLE